MSKRIFEVQTEMREGGKWINWSSVNVVARDAGDAVKKAERAERLNDTPQSAKRFPVRAIGVKLLAEA